MTDEQRLALIARLIDLAALGRVDKQVVASRIAAAAGEQLDDVLEQVRAAWLEELAGTTDFLAG